MFRPNGEKHRCMVCGHIYDPKRGDLDNSIAPGTGFRELPEDWMCPECNTPKDQFEKV